MTVAEYIVDKLIQYNVTDAFGIPGGVILKLLYAMDERADELTPHLNYHEQMAGFAACGYAQASGKLGVAYATRGPGITNMITCIAEAYQESLPVLFITAHGTRTENGMRFANNQELNIVNATYEFTKYGSNIETINEVTVKLNQAFKCALTGRKGPVILDFSSQLFGQEVLDTSKTEFKNDFIQNEPFKAIQKIHQQLTQAKRPVVLIGDGARIYKNEACIKSIEKLGCPILSSRASQDLFSQSALYYGYIGSHGLRYSNFILSKADLIIVIGNRMAFPPKSKSFEPIMKKQIIRIDIDKNEFIRNIPYSSNFMIEAENFIQALNDDIYSFDIKAEWVGICNILRKELNSYDVSEPVQKLIKFLQCQSKEYQYVCDIGNNEFWFARAYESVRPKGKVLYSKSYGTLGAALGRAIGAYYATAQDTICIIGDQGFQYNIQELQFISYWNLPIGIILLNNSSSGMISDHEKKISNFKLIHVNEKTGYTTPDFKKIICGYKIDYISSYDEWSKKTNAINKEGILKPFVYEINFDSDITLEPNLPSGNACQNMTPLLDDTLYNRLEQL